MTVNKAILVGNLGQDPEIRYTQGGQAVANFSLATGESWTDQQGQKQERTEWHKIVVWGRQAESVAKCLTKGRQVYVEGKITTRKWQGQDGQDRYTTEIVAQTVQFLGARNGGGSGFGEGSGGYGDGGRAAFGGRGSSTGGSGPGADHFGGPPPDGFSDDDIPF